MPHICTRCNNIFHKGDDILKGCPVCGWKKFLFARKVPEQNQEIDSKTTITKAMGVRIPPRAERAETFQNEIAGEALYVKKALKSDVFSESPAKQEPELGNKSYLPPLPPEKGEAKVESIKITAPGTYELNLPSLFEREELIMAVKEGTYLIDLSSVFRKGKKE